MNKNLIAPIACFLAFGFGMSLNNPALSDGNLKIAKVNVAKLLQNSPSIKSATDAKISQTKEMLKWYDTASADIEKQQSKEGKEALIKKYEAQLTSKKKAINDAYSKKISDADKQIENVIQQKAKELGYNLVLRSDALIYGGKDITQEVMGLVK